MSRLTRDGTAEPVSRDQNFRHARGQENTHFPCSADHEQKGNLTRLIHTLLYVLTIHTYIFSRWEDQCEWHRMTRMTRPGLRGYVQFNKYTYIHKNDSDDWAGLRGYMQLNKYTYIHTYICNLINTYISLIPPREDQCEWHRMTRMTAGLRGYVQFNKYIHTYIHTYPLGRINASGIE